MKHFQKRTKRRVILAIYLIAMPFWVLICDHINDVLRHAGHEEPPTKIVELIAILLIWSLPTFVLLVYDAIDFGKQIGMKELIEYATLGLMPYPLFFFLDLGLLKLFHIKSIFGIDCSHFF